MAEFRAQPVYGRSVESLVRWQDEIAARTRLDGRRNDESLHSGPWRGWRPDALIKASPMRTSARAAEVRVSHTTGGGGGGGGGAPPDDALLELVEQVLPETDLRFPNHPPSSTPGAPEPPDTDPSEAPDPA
jgi:hypothetical protein